MNLSVLPASCRQKGHGSADETSAARCSGVRLFFRRFTDQMRVQSWKIKPAFSCSLALLSAVAGSRAFARDRETSPANINHTFLATGAETRIISGDGQTIWRYPRGTRDGWVLPNGNILLAVSKDHDYPGGAVVELRRDGKTVFEWKGTQSEVNTAQSLANGNILLTEAGAKPRLLEVNREGKIVIDYVRSVMVWKRAHAPNRDTFPKVMS